LAKVLASRWSCWSSAAGGALAGRAGRAGAARPPPAPGGDRRRPVAGWRHPV